LITFNRDNNYKGNYGNVLHSIWEVSSGQVIRRFESSSNSSEGLGVSPDGQYAFTAGYGGSAEFRGLVFDIASGAINNFYGVASGTMSPDGKYLLLGNYDSSNMQLIPLPLIPNRQPVTITPAYLLNGAIFSTDGQYLVTGSPENTATIWKFPSLEKVTVLRGQKGNIRAAAWSKDGKFVVTVDVEGTARIWEATTGTTLAILHGTPERVLDVGFSSDNKKIFVASKDTVQLYDCEICGSMPELIALAGKQVTRELTTQERQQYLGEK
jgi:WD40 repeat protein